jgi:hypothetical protein
MNRDDVIKMARGHNLIEMDHDCIEGVPIDKLPAFAALVAAHEREECAKLCEEMREHYSNYKDTALLNSDIDLSNAASGEPRACEFLAAAIRTRGNK